MWASLELFFFHIYETSSLQNLRRFKTKRVQNGGFAKPLKCKTYSNISRCNENVTYCSKGELVQKIFNHKLQGIQLWRSRKLFRYFELAQLTGGGLGRSKPATNLMQAH
jgi:hypothetical protein